MVDQKTAHLKLPLPHPDNCLDEDLPRIRTALQTLDTHAQTTDETLAAHDERLESASADIASEILTREQNDAAQAEVLATLCRELAALTETVTALKNDPWKVFPLRVPIAVDGVTFPTWEETRPVLDDEGQPVSGEDGEPLTETITVQGRHPIMPGETEPRENWLICDGGDDGQGGTVPDLRGRMILGASDTHQAGDTGGSETHEHSLSGTVGETTLSVAQLANHGHSVYAALLHTGSTNRGEWAAINNLNINTSSVGDSQSHTHTLSGASGNASGLPPYYALAYIMRCA